LVLVATAASLVLLFLVTKLVLQPIGQIRVMSQKVINGDLTARVGARPPGEMGALCQAVDAMADAIAQREEQLKLVTRQQIGQTEKLASLGRLAAGVAHEINNPLTGVLTFAHLLRQKPNMDDQDRQDLDLIINETTRVAEIVRGLLDFARERPAAKRPLDLNEIIRRTIRLLSGQKGFQQIIVVEDLDEGLPKVEGDENQLQQLLLNLSLNACEAMPQGGTLMVQTSARNGAVAVKVSDTGCGIKKEHLDRIFEPFFSTKPVGKGTGLGLSVSYGIAQQHGGTLEVESEEGKGSTFTIVLPSVSSSSPDGKENADT
jgi:two-component system NtrC family sensor kinase